MNSESSVKHPLSYEEITSRFNEWLHAWNSHDLEGVMNFIHDDIIFENWNRTVVAGKQNLTRAWLAWFLNHGNFRFDLEDLFIDTLVQKISFAWVLKWPSLEKKYAGKQEERQGIDVLHLQDGKIIKKLTYCKTQIFIDKKSVTLIAP